MDGTAGSIDPILDGLSVAFDKVFGDERRRPVLAAEPASLTRAREVAQDDFEAAHEHLQGARKLMAALLPPLPPEALAAIEDYADAKGKFGTARYVRDTLGQP